LQQRAGVENSLPFGRIREPQQDAVSSIHQTIPPSFPGASPRSPFPEYRRNPVRLPDFNGTRPAALSHRPDSLTCPRADGITGLGAFIKGAAMTETIHDVLEAVRRLAGAADSPPATGAAICPSGGGYRVARL
jgi:hypothetical protein